MSAVETIWGEGERRPAVAGTFYPGDPDLLAATVDRLLDDAARALAAAPVHERPPRAVIVPHAGYVYSGPVAASAYVRILPYARAIRRVLLLGPAHRVPVSGAGLALSSASAWRTPIGSVVLDPYGCAAVAQVPGVVVDDRPHAPEHSLEVHLPFLQRVLAPGWTLVPLVVGHAAPATVAAAIDLLWDDPATLVVVSTDLSHYHPYNEAVALDRSTVAAVASLRGNVHPDQACGAFPMGGLLHVLREDPHHYDVELVDLRNSGDTSGPKDQVVGYASFVIRDRTARAASLA